ncbi:MAG TPA: hydroxyacid dehydrogenase, partial [Actinobacteria bacterium]|nr:hydroxyacid dehydrogenase [Actinomycetota bacterium]
MWLDPADMDGLRAALATAQSARWVQLPFAGVERVAGAGLLDPAREWTSAKGAYAEPVAEHALMLALAGLR